MIYLGYLFLGTLLVALVILAVPISLGYDSTTRRLRVKWLGLTIIRRPKAEKPKKPPEVTKKKWKLRTLAVIRRLWQKRDLVLELISKVGRFVLQVWQTLSFHDSKVAVSLPDPFWNGMLCAILPNIPLRELDFSVNFESRNYAKIWVTVYPYRVVQKLTVLLVRLPYIRILRLAWDLKKYRQPLKD